jgi:hypothetical protein
MTQETWIPHDAPLDKPNPARIYDYFLGGYHNFAEDRAIADKLLEIFPDLCLSAQVNRAFLRRAVTYLVEQGLDQFLDIGSGIPTMGNVHEVAQALNPEVRVVYVDIEPVAVAHGRAMLADNPRAVAISADVREPDVILGHDEVCRLLDFDRPLGLTMVALLHYVLDDEIAYRSVDRLRQALAPGSYMAVAHTTPVAHARTGGKREESVKVFRSAGEQQSRTHEQILPFFGDWQLVDPGLVFTPLWRPEGPDDVFVNEPARGFTRAGMARKPAARG